MTDTIIPMDYRFVDQLRPDQVMVGDFIEFSDEFITEIGRVTDIEEIYENREYSYIIHGRNDFDETLELVVKDEWQLVKLFILE